jgi:hypothetical protein
MIYIHIRLTYKDILKESLAHIVVRRLAIIHDNMGWGRVGFFRFGVFFT